MNKSMSGEVAAYIYEHPGCSQDDIRAAFPASAEAAAASAENLRIVGSVRARRAADGMDRYYPDNRAYMGMAAGMQVGDKLRSIGIMPNAWELKTRAEIVETRDRVSRALNELTRYDSELANKLAALPPEEVDDLGD